MSEHSTIIALSEPPLGESSNFVDPPSLAFLFSIICFVLLGISAICVGLRLYTRKVILGAIGADDCKFTSCEHECAMALVYFFPSLIETLLKASNRHSDLGGRAYTLWQQFTQEVFVLID